MSKIKTTEASRVFLRKFAHSRKTDIAHFIAGANMVLRHLSGESEDPMEIDAITEDGMTSVFIVYGEWITSEKAHFPGFEHLDWGGHMPPVPIGGPARESYPIPAD